MRIDRFFWLLAASLILLACGKEMPGPQSGTTTARRSWCKGHSLPSTRPRRASSSA